MKETPIPLEDTGLSLGDWIARARREQTTFVVLDASTPVARLVPAAASHCTGADLARALAGTSLSPEDAQAWREDISQSRAKLTAPEDKWR